MLDKIFSFKDSEIFCKHVWLSGLIVLVLIDKPLISTCQLPSMICTKK